MQTYWDLTHRERLALTEDEIKSVYIPREALTKGFLVPKPPVLMPLPEKPDAEMPATKPYFSVKGRLDTDKYGASLEFTPLFKDLESTNIFIGLRPLGVTTEWKNHQNISGVVTPISYEVEIKNISDKEAQRVYTETMAAYDEAARLNKEATSAYENELRKIQQSSESIWKDWNALLSRRAYLEQLIETLGEFVKITEGNVTMAIQFLMKKEEAQGVFDALREIPHDYEWDMDVFDGKCLSPDENPYRDCGKSPF